ncbi:hypothetical protein GCM10010486_88350 [Nonomuraea roseoviolacea subsp. carminata]
MPTSATGLSGYACPSSLADQGRAEELRARVDAGDGSAAPRLAEALAQTGRLEEAELVRRVGLPLDGDRVGAGGGEPVTHQRNPASRTFMATWTRLSAPSLAKMRVMLALTVATLM